MTLKPGVWLLFYPLHLAAERAISFSDWVNAEKALLSEIYIFENSAFCQLLVYYWPKLWSLLVRQTLWYPLKRLGL
jgi:hypothetical protein